jgi:ATP-dependent exoDNAse (exonuclease V) beta subunit
MEPHKRVPGPGDGARQVAKVPDQCRRIQFGDEAAHRRGDLHREGSWRDEDASAEEQKRLERALSELELARIGTIHAFCGDLLRERPIEAGIDPLFKVAAEDEASELADQAFETWFQAALGDPPEAVRRILRRRSKRQPPREALRSALGSLIDHRDFPGTVATRRV